MGRGEVEVEGGVREWVWGGGTWWWWSEDPGVAGTSLTCRRPASPVDDQPHL